MPQPPAYRRNPDVSWRVIDGQAVLIHNRLGEVNVLNDVGTYIWEHVEEDLEALPRNISREYEVSEEEARQDLRAFLEDLLSSGALVEAGEE